MLTEVETSGIIRDVDLRTYGPGDKIGNPPATFNGTETEGRTGVPAWMVGPSTFQKTERELKDRLDELEAISKPLFRWFAAFEKR